MGLLLLSIDASATECPNANYVLSQTIEGDCLIPQSEQSYSTHLGGTTVNGNILLESQTNPASPIAQLNLNPSSPLNILAPYSLILGRSSILYGSGTISGNIISDGTLDPTHSTPYVTAIGKNPLNISLVNSFADVPIGSVGQASEDATLTINGTFRAKNQVLSDLSNSALGFSITPSANSQILLGPSSSMDLRNVHLSVETLGLGIGPGYNLKTTWTLIQSTDSSSTIIGTFLDPRVQGLPDGEVYNLTYVKDSSVLLTIYPNHYFQELGKTRNEKLVGTILDRAIPKSTGQLYADLNQLYQISGGQFNKTLNQLDGELYAEAPGILYATVTDSWNPVYARMGLSATQGGTGPDRSSHFWTSGVGNFGGVEGNSNSDGFSQHSQGFMGGADAALTDNINVGLTAGYIGAGGTRNNTLGTISAQLWQLGLYGDWAVGKTGRLGLLVGYTQGPLQFSNPTAIGTATSDTTARLITAEILGDWRVDYGGGHSLTPIISLQSVSDLTDGFSERGLTLGSFQINSPDYSGNFVATRIQTRYDYQWKQWGVDWTASTAIGLREMLYQPVSNATLTYQGISESYQIRGSQSNANTGAGLFNLGLTGQLNDAFKMELGYRGTYSGNMVFNAFQGNLVWNYDQITQGDSSKYSFFDDASEDKDKKPLDIRDPGPDLANYPNSAFTLPQGGFYLETMTMNYQSDSVSSAPTYSSTFFFRYGLLDDVELRLFYEALVVQTGGSVTAGSGPLTFDTKIHFWDEWEEYFIPATGFEASIQTPWMASTAFAGTTQPTFTLNFDHSLPYDIGLEYNVGAQRVQDQYDLSQNLWQFVGQWALQRDLFEDFALFVNGTYNGGALPKAPRRYTKAKEVTKVRLVCSTGHEHQTIEQCRDQNYVTQETYTVTASSSSVDITPVIAGGGFIWTVDDHISLYGNAGAGLTDTSPPFQAYVGFAWTP